MDTKYVENIEEVGTWQNYFERTCSDRVKNAIKRAVRTPEVCVEHALTEIEVHKETDGKVPHIIQRAMIFKRFEETRTLHIYDDELIVGNVNSKIRGSLIFGYLLGNQLAKELDDPVYDYEIRPHDRHHISEEERKIIREQIVPFFKGHCMEDEIYATAEGEVRDKAMACGICPHIPNFADLMTRADAGHALSNYEKVLRIGLNGIRKEVEFYKHENEQPYSHFYNKEKEDFYNACLISLEGAEILCNRYSALAAEMAEKETDPKRKAELLEISRITKKVPMNPAESFYEALQSVWMIQVLILGEQINYADSFGRFDQYIYPYYKMSVEDKKEMTREQALELMELFFVKTSEWTQLYDYNSSSVQVAFPITQNLLIGGQTKQGTDACNEVTMLCLEAEEQVGLIQPELAMRIWEGTPDKYLFKAAEVGRLGRGKPKFYGDRKAIEMMRHAYPDMREEDLRDYAVIGCIEISMPHITQQHSASGMFNMGKILDLTFHNGKCSICGKQLGPETGDPRTFKTMDEFMAAYKKQNDYFMNILCKAVTVEMNVQAKWSEAPFTSCLLEGPLQKGVDLIKGGCWNTSFGLMLTGSANVGDSLAVLDTLVYKEKKYTMDEMLKAIDADWVGYEAMREHCINDVPKYGNDNDYADGWVATAQNIWYDAIDEANKYRDNFPAYGGYFRGGSCLGNTAVTSGLSVCALPDGLYRGHPMADAMSPTQGRDVNGTTAVQKSMSKLPSERFEMGTLLNQRLTPQMLATEDDVWRFVNYLRAFEALGNYHVQFNVIDCNTLRKAMEKPEDYKDLLVRVASYVSYFVELGEPDQLDILHRTEQNEW